MAFIEDKMHLTIKWFDRVRQRKIKPHVKRVDAIEQVSSKIGKRRSRKTW